MSIYKCHRCGTERLTDNMVAYCASCYCSKEQDGIELAAVELSRKDAKIAELEGRTIELRSLLDEAKFKQRILLGLLKELKVKAELTAQNIGSVLGSNFQKDDSNV